MLNKKFIFKLILILSIAGILGNIFDAGTTYFALQKDGTYESNLLMRYIIDNFGYASFFIVKLAFVYLIFPYKYCPLYSYISYITKSKKIKNKIIHITIMVIVYVFLTLWFWKLALGNLRHII